MTECASRPATKHIAWLGSGARHLVLAGALSVGMVSSGRAENLRVEPFDRSSQNAGRSAFLEDFKEAVHDRDADVILAVTAPDVVVFNDPAGGGAATLRRQLTEGWSGAEAAAYWEEMEKALELGGGFLADGRYCAPYVYAYALPGATDSLSDAFVVRERAPLYDSPDLGAGVLGHLSYAVVPVSRRLDRDWIEVLLADGRKGYLSRNDFRIRGDYHLCFADGASGWRLTVFNVGE